MPDLFTCLRCPAQYTWDEGQKARRKFRPSDLFVIPFSLLNMYVTRGKAITARKAKYVDVCPQCFSFHVWCPGCETRQRIDNTQYGGLVNCDKCKISYSTFD